jgi:hypothetical protein
MIESMHGVQQIHYRGRLAAVVLGGEATIDAQLAGEELVDVQAMCLFAIAIANGEQPGTYSDQRAAAFAAQTRAQRALTRGWATDGG